MMAASQMKCLDLTMPTPAENLACDEALLDYCENGYEHEILRFWEPQTYFAVVGYANRVAGEINQRACRAANIPVLRRCSGGGTVLQGPGCLNYSLILKIAEDGPLRGIASANRFILERNRAALGTLPPPAGPRPEPPSAQPQIMLQGHTDLSIGGRKFSGNAQRRKKCFLLFHGTFLLHFDLGLIEETLPLPSRQPEYRLNRAHADFLVNFAAPADSVKRVLRQAWRAFDPLECLPRDRILLLSRDKYATDGWNLKF